MESLQLAHPAVAQAAETPLFGGASSGIAGLAECSHATVASLAVGAALLVDLLQFEAVLQG